MKAGHRWVLGVYRGLLRLYPPDFRAEFGAEMVASFTDMLSDVLGQKWDTVAAACLRELRELPGVAFQQWWRWVRSFIGEGRMNTVQALDGSSLGIQTTFERGDRPGSWRDALLAGAPHLTFMVIIILVTLQAAGFHQPAPLWVNILFLVLVWSLVAAWVVALVIAWRRGWPRWSASLFTYFAILVYSPFLLAVQNWGGANARQLEGFLLRVLPGLVYGLLAYAVVRRDAVKGLLMLTPAITLMWFPVLEFVPGAIRNPLQMGMFGITSLAAVLIARRGNWRIGVWLVTASSALIGLPIAYFRTYHHNIPPEHADPSTIEMLIGRYLQTLTWSVLLLAAPILLWLLWELGRRAARRGRWGFRLALTGLALNLFSISMARTMYSNFLVWNVAFWEVFYGILILLGVGLYLGGVLVLLAAAEREGLFQHVKHRLQVFLAALVFPLMFVLPIFEMRPYKPSSLPYGLLYQSRVSHMLVYVGAAFWLLLAIYWVTRLNLPRSTAPGPHDLL